MRVTVNLNNYARVRLTARGRRIWHDAWAPYSSDGTGMDHKVSETGELREQLWQIMQIFGPYVANGSNPFAIVEIEIEDATPIDEPD